MFHASFLPNDSGCQKVAKSRKAERLQAHPAKKGEFPKEGAGSVGWLSVNTAPEAALCMSFHDQSSRMEDQEGAQGKPTLIKHDR